jgi:hypothetical protein
MNKDDSNEKELTMSDETIRDRVIRLIKEMRNQTVDKGATPAEAAMFAAKAAEWIEKHQIDEEELRVKSGGSRTAPVDVWEDYIPTGKKVFNPGVTRVVDGLATAMCCKVILLHVNDGEAVYAITGDKIDTGYVCQASMMIVSSLQTMARLEGAEHGYEKAGLVRWANQYLTGAAVEIKKRIEQERKDRSEVKQMEHQLNHSSTSGSCTAIVLVTGETIAAAKRTAVAAEFKRRYPKTRKTYSSSEYNQTAHERGREAGKKVGLRIAIK